MFPWFSQGQGTDADVERTVQQNQLADILFLFLF